MYCKKCGQIIPDDSVYCNHCGTRQTTRKILVELKKPSLPTINEDSIRNVIFCIGRFFKQCFIFLKQCFKRLLPLFANLLIIGLVICSFGFVSYYTYYFFNKPPKASLEEVNLYREEGIHSREIYWKQFKITDTVHDYDNPSDILPNCKWKFDDEMIEDRFYIGDESANINIAREKYLKEKSYDFAVVIMEITACIIFISFLIRLFIKFRKWLYKKE